MEYQIITPKDQAYPKKLIERLGDECPDKIYYNGPLELLNSYSMAVISADSIYGQVMIETNQILFTIREYEMNYIGSWHSVMETEIFRLSLFRKNTTTTLFSAKGLNKENFESYLRDRFYPPLHEFPEEEEYWRRAQNGELLILSISDPDEGRHLRKNIMARNWIACILADIVFVPYGPKGSKTYTTAKRVFKKGIPIFTNEGVGCNDLHEIGIPRFNRQTIGKFLENRGAKISIPKKEMQNNIVGEKQMTFAKISNQTELNFDRKGIDKD
ncbi:hypothetical protein JW824_05345 [bacterium]|nr:hypothetical protein [bacterium]RQV96301.1 MAG: hypothetical protein EH221_04850 [bacterium]